MLQLWPEAAIEAMHRASLALLERVGVRVESSTAADLLLAAGCFLGPQGRVCLPATLVEEAVAAHRREYVLVARGSGKSLTVGPDPGPTYVHNLGGARDVIDVSTGVGQRATMSDQLALTRIMHHLINQQSITALASLAMCLTSSNRCTLTSLLPGKPTRPLAVPASRRPCRQPISMRWPRS